MSLKTTFKQSEDKLRPKLYEKEIKNSHINVIQPNLKKESCVQRLYDAAIENPQTNVVDLLKKLNISQIQYKNLRENHMSVPEFRKAKFGLTKFVKPTTKEKQAAILEVARLKRFNRNVFRNKNQTLELKPPKQDVKSKRGRGGEEDSEDDTKRLNEMFKLAK
jgi:hypothetical protein